MKECAYCKNKIQRGHYLCAKCKKELLHNDVHTGNPFSDWVINSYLYVEQNKGNYWKDEKSIANGDKMLQFIRPIDYIRFNTFVECSGKDKETYPLSAENMNEMEKWYLALAEKERERLENG